MKKILFINLILIIFLFSNCKKYPDGPSISFRSRTERLSNSWHMKQYFENGTDKTNDFNNTFKEYCLTIKKNGECTTTYKLFGLVNVSDAGKWSFNSNQTGLTFVNNTNNETTNWTILKLKENELWGSYIDSNKTIEVHLIP